jgi:hypothetical protein
MGDHHSGEYLRTGAPVAYGAPYHSEDGRESSSKLTQYHGDNGSLKQSNGHSNGQHHSTKIHKEKVIAIARVWNEVTILLWSVGSERSYIRRFDIIKPLINAFPSLFEGGNQTQENNFGWSISKIPVLCHYLSHSFAASKERRTLLRTQVHILIGSTWIIMLGCSMASSNS